MRCNLFVRCVVADKNGKETRYPFHEHSTLKVKTFFCIFCRSTIPDASGSNGFLCQQRRCTARTKNVWEPASDWPPDALERVGDGKSRTPIFLGHKNLVPGVEDERFFSEMQVELNKMGDQKRDPNTRVSECHKALTSVGSWMIGLVLGFSGNGKRMSFVDLGCGNGVVNLVIGQVFKPAFNVGVDDSHESIQRALFLQNLFPTAAKFMCGNISALIVDLEIHLHLLAQEREPQVLAIWWANYCFSGADINTLSSWLSSASAMSGKVRIVVAAMTLLTKPDGNDLFQPQKYALPKQATSWKTAIEVYVYNIGGFNDTPQQLVQVQLTQAPQTQAKYRHVCFPYTPRLSFRIANPQPEPVTRFSTQWKICNKNKELVAILTMTNVFQRKLFLTRKNEKASVSVNAVQVATTDSMFQIKHGDMLTFPGGSTKSFIAEIPHDTDDPQPE